MSQIGHSKRPTMNRSDKKELDDLKLILASLILIVIPLLPAGVEGGYPLILIGLGAMMPTAFVGFLFCIPRYSDLPPASADSPSKALQINSNLVQISDWLTKIIVGVGLVQLLNIPTFLGHVIRYLCRGSTRLISGDVLAVILYYSFLGVSIGYLLTRLMLTRMMQEADASLSSGITASAQLALQKAPLVPEGSSASQPLNSLASGAVEIAKQFKLEDLKTFQDILLWAKAHLAYGDTASAKLAYQRAVNESPNDPQAHFGYAVALHETNADAQQVLAELEIAKTNLTAASDANLRLNVYLWLTYMYLYEDRPKGYQMAQKTGVEYLAIPGRLDSAGLRINIACAYGQEADDLKSKPFDAGSTERFEALVDKAISELKIALQIDPSIIERLRQLAGLRSSNDGDDDLKVFAEEKRFSEFLEKG